MTVDQHQGGRTIARSLTALHERPGHAWDLATMAEAAGMSRSGFTARFKELIGEPPAEYLLRWRISIAQGLLRGGMPLKAAASQLGYSAPSLSRAFSQVVGLSPRDWIKRTA